jgi:uncharacterized OB-fold protein
MPDATVRPAPILTDDNRFFWEAAREGRLVGQRCASCQRFRHPPRPMCPHCDSLDHDEVDLVGRGTVYSYAVLHHPRSPRFDYPIIAALVDLEEGLRMVSNLVDVDTGEIRIGMPVEVRFVATADDMMVPVFLPGEADR